MSTHTTEVVVPTGTPVTNTDEFQARCSCGWHGTIWQSRSLAQASANGHFVFPEMVVQSCNWVRNNGVVCERPTWLGYEQCRMHLDSGEARS
jgi:hypothetical protein